MAKNGKTKHYSKQHFVPQSYTKAWCDPESKGKSNLTPYIWQFDKLGNNARAKSPGKLFTETDIYTIPLPDGERDLSFEHGFQQLEDSFTRLRNLKLSKHKPLDPADLQLLHIFAATAQTRTAAYRNFHREQWKDIREKIESVNSDFKKATEAEKETMRMLRNISTGDYKNNEISLNDIRRLEDFPIQEMMSRTLPTVLPMYAKMHTAILYTDDDLGFATTDHPVTWFNPDAHKLHPMMRSPGLAFKDIEVTMPISPTQCLFISHHNDFSGYMPIPDVSLTELNRRHIWNCDEHFILQRNEIRDIWFEKREMPEDAWEKIHGD
jgi:hypothetical protein